MYEKPNVNPHKHRENMHISKQGVTWAQDQISDAESVMYSAYSSSWTYPWFNSISFDFIPLTSKHSALSCVNLHTFQTSVCLFYPHNHGSLHSASSLCSSTFTVIYNTTNAKQSVPNPKPKPNPNRSQY